MSLYKYFEFTYVLIPFFPSTEKKLEEIEEKHSITSRWTPSDKEYQKLEHSLVTDKKEQLLMAIWKAVKRRVFLLKLKAKYAGMLWFVNLP